MAEAVGKVGTNLVVGKLKFGFGQISNVTPQFAKNIFRYVLYTAAVINIIMMVISEIPQPIKDTVARYSIEVVTLVHAFSKLFGLDLEDTPVGLFSSKENVL